MRALLTVVLALAPASFALAAKEKCGEYLFAGKPGKEGIYIFADTSNETFVRIKGLNLAGKLERLQADYVVKAVVVEYYGALPKEAQLLKVEGPASTLQQVERGLIQLTEKKCGR